MAKHNQIFPVRTKRKSLKKVKKRRRREYSSKSSSSSSEEDGPRSNKRHSTATFPYFNPVYNFPGQLQGDHNPMPFMYQPLQPYPQMSRIQQGFQLANSDHNFVQNRNLCNTLPLRDKNVGFASSSAMSTSATQSSTTSVNESKTWCNLDTLVTTAINCDDHKSD